MFLCSRRFESQLCTGERNRLTEGIKKSKGVEQDSKNQGKKPEQLTGPKMKQA